MKRYPEDPGFEKDSDTSEAAAEAAIPTREAGMIMVRRLIDGAETAEPPGLTCDEMEVISGGAHQSVSARVRDCVLAGWIYDSGVRRLTRRGRKANVYRLKTASIVAAADTPTEPTLF